MPLNSRQLTSMRGTQLWRESPLLNMSNLGTNQERNQGNLNLEMETNFQRTEGFQDQKSDLKTKRGSKSTCKIKIISLKMTQF
jgi:hypothetical protein